MSEDENKAIVRRFIEEVYNNGNFSALGELVSENWTLHTAAGATVIGLEEEQKYVARGRSPFPDYRITIEDMVAEGDKVAVRATRRGTQKEPLRNVPPTDKSVSVARYTIYRLEGGKLVEGWTIDDRYGQFQQLGILPSTDKLGK